MNAGEWEEECCCFRHNNTCLFNAIYPSLTMRCGHSQVHCWRHSIIINTESLAQALLPLRSELCMWLTLPKENRSFAGDTEWTDSVTAVYASGHLEARGPTAQRGIFQSGHGRPSQGGFVVKITLQNKCRAAAWRPASPRTSSSEWLNEAGDRASW